MQDIQSIDDLQQLVLTGFKDWESLGAVKVKQHQDFLIFNYLDIAEGQNRWNFFERVSRGLILHAKTGEVVARAFDKFFNWHSYGRVTEAPISRVMEKMDGSLGILYRDGHDYKVATRSDFKNPQCQFANTFIKRFDLSDLAEEYTLIFEIIYPKNRIIVDYRDREDLVLLGIRNRFTGDFLNWQDVQNKKKKYGFSLPMIYPFYSITELLENTQQLSGLEEGYVVEFNDGQFFKFKSNRYIELSCMTLGLSFQKIVSTLENHTFDNFVVSLPEEFTQQAEDYKQQALSIYQDTLLQAQHAFAQAPSGDRKNFAQWAQQNHPTLRPYLFALWDNSDLRPLIYKHAFKGL